jgi:hypothetical protein
VGVSGVGREREDGRGGGGRKNRTTVILCNQWHMQVIFSNFTRLTSKERAVCEVPISLFYQNSKVRDSFNFLFKAELLKLKVLDLSFLNLN